jgi:chromosome segregation ATPase
MQITQEDLDILKREIENLKLQRNKAAIEERRKYLPLLDKMRQEIKDLEDKNEELEMLLREFRNEFCGMA